MSNPKVSAGAFRAASAIGGHFGFIRDEKDAELVARLIDFETGVGELLEAAKFALSVARAAGDRPDSYKQIEQAIAKREGSE